MSTPPNRIDVHDITPAGTFSSWLQRTRRALVSDIGADVPCGSCTACCTASYYVYVRPEETRTLARIPKQHLIALPRLPAGYLAMGWDENGHCPMLVDGRCSIYADRPQTCRDFDCRIFPATGIDADDKPLIAAQTRRWRFEHGAQHDADDHAAVRAAAAFLRDHADAFTTWAIPSNPNQLAVLAIKASRAFEGAPDRATRDAPELIVQAVMTEVRKFDVASASDP